MAKIALIEINNFHDECLYSHILFLKSDGNHVTLICNQKLKSRVENFPADEFVFLNLDSKIRKYISWFLVRRTILKQKISKVILNTAEKNIYKLLLLPFPRSVEFIGVVHNIQKIKNSRKQNLIISKLDKILTLGKFIFRNLQEEKLTHKKANYYYPIFFEEHPQIIQKPANEIWITIPGIIDFRKRDNQRIHGCHIPKNVKIIMLGRPVGEEACEFLKQLKNHPTAAQFITFDNFISPDLFHSYIRESDYILPLIHQNTESFSDYLRYKISGSYNLAFAYKIPLLLDESLKEIEDFAGNAIFYRPDELCGLFKELKPEKDIFYKNPELTFEHQKENYLNFIFDRNESN